MNKISKEQGNLPRALNAPLLEAEGLTCTIDGRRILDAVTLAVKAGEFISIIGPNGAGKTTLLRCLRGIIEDWKGVVRVDGRDAHSYPRRGLARLMSYVPQATGRPMPFKVRRFVEMGRYPYLSPFESMTREDYEAVENSMRRAEVYELQQRNMATLSGGEAQRVFIAAALAQEARLMLLDEPTVFLDPAHEDAVLRLLRESNRLAGVAVMQVTHDINIAGLYADRVLALKNGKVVYDGPAREVLDNKHLHKIFGKDFLFAEHPRAGVSVVVPGRKET